MSSAGISEWSDPPPDDISAKSVFVDSFAIFGVVRRFANALMDDDFRLCYHRECPHYGANQCNSWIFVPAHYESCTFPGRIRFLKEEIGNRVKRNRPKFELRLFDATTFAELSSKLRGKTATSLNA
jgi:hypothetical protein